MWRIWILLVIISSMRFIWLSRKICCWWIPYRNSYWKVRSFHLVFPMAVNFAQGVVLFMLKQIFINIEKAAEELKKTIMTKLASLYKCVWHALVEVEEAESRDVDEACGMGWRPRQVTRVWPQVLRTFRGHGSIVARDIHFQTENSFLCSGKSKVWF